MEIHGHVTAVRQEVEGEETTAAVLATETLIPVSAIVDFDSDGGHVRIDGEVYAYSAIDTGEESGVVSITLDTGLVANVAAETRVEVWNTSTGTVVSEWKVDVTDDLDGTPGVATLSHTLIPMMSSGMPLEVGDSVTVVVDDAGAWWLTEVHGATPGYDPGFIRTGGLGADTVVWAGTENGRRAQLDGIDGALEAFNSSNQQTVNIDGDVNYIEGTLATAASGARVEIGPGPDGIDPVNEVRLPSENVGESAPAAVRSTSAGPNSILTLAGATVPGVGIGIVTISGELIQVTGAPLDATMGAGSVGTSTFRDSVDARVTALAQPLDTDLTAISALTSAADRLPYATGAGTWALTDITSLGRAILDDTTVADVRSTIQAKAARPTVNSQTGTSYTLVLTDEQKIIQVSNAAAHTLTIPANASVAFAIGTELEVFRLGAGAVNIAPDAGVTINSRGGLLSVNGQYGSVRLRKRLADTWVLTGDLV